MSKKSEIKEAKKWIGYYISEIERHNVMIGRCEDKIKFYSDKIDHLKLSKLEDELEDFDEIPF